LRSPNSEVCSRLRRHLCLNGTLRKSLTASGRSNSHTRGVMSPSQNSTFNSPSGSLNNLTITGYSIPVGGVAFLLIPATEVLQDIYPKFYGVKFGSIAAAGLVASLVTAVANPLLGALSDAWRQCGGGRRSWVLGGYCLFIFSAFHLLVPGENVTAVKFSIWLLLTQLTWTIFDVPHLAWGAELATKYGDRTRLFCIRDSIVMLGSAVFYVMPLLPLFETQEVTPITLKCAAWVGVASVLPVGICIYAMVPEGARVATRSKRVNIRDACAVLSNRPFMILVGASVLITIGQGLWMTLAFVIYDYYYHVGPRLAQMYLFASILTAVLLPVFVRITDSVGKKSMLMCLQGAFTLAAFAPMFLSPGGTAVTPLLLVLSTVIVIQMFNNSIMNAALADAADYGVWKFRHSQAASYYAVAYLFTLLADSVAGPSGLALISRMGFASQGIVDQEAATAAVHTVFVLIPLLLTGAATLLLWHIPLSARRAKAIRRRIQSQDRAGATREAPVELPVADW
jgi:glycoside/pentoside/hexuronide:cation symporter, GPH family